MPWTEFTDMYSKGFRKTDWDKIYIEATKNDAISVFLDIFGIDPDFVTCSCCGPN